MPHALRSTLSSAVSLAVATAGLTLVVTPPAQAAGPDAATTAVTKMLGRLATGFLPELASSTALAQQLPTLAVTPAGSVGLKTAFSDALATDGPLAGAGAQTTLAELSSYIDKADRDRWVFTSTMPDATTVSVGFTRTVTTDAGLDVRDQDGTLSLSTGQGIDVTGTLTGAFTFVYDQGTKTASLTNPSLTIATTADLPAGKRLDAGLGILGVEVVGTAGDGDYRLASTVRTTWANPDNDAAGRLSYDNPETTTDGDDGELAADGAATGLVTASRTGSLAGQLVAKPRDSTTVAGVPPVVAGLPSVGATVTVSSASPATFEAPAVTSVVPEAAEPFLTLTPRDLAAGLSQAASAVIGMQDAEDGQLPLMRGSIGNAVDAVGGIKAFLADQVPDADPDDETPGQPKFASLQDMLTALDQAAYADSGWSIEVLGGTEAARFDPLARVASFTVRATRGGVEDLELNPLGAPTTGAGTFSDTGLVATGVDLDGPDGTSGADLVGRKVSAGTSYGTIASIDSGTSLTLTPDGWSAGTPTTGNTFSIEAADPKTGAPEFADSLARTAGIEAANADLSTALVTPTVVVTLPMALDLSAPLKYVDGAGATVLDCDPSAATAPCPFKQVDASGLGRVITSLPLVSDRILLRQSARDIVVADAAITSPVQISTTSGFLALSVGGSVKLTVPSGQHLQVLSLKGSGNISIPAFVEQVRQQAVNVGKTADVFTQVLGGSVEAKIDVSVDDAPDAFAAGASSTSLTVRADVAKLADGVNTDVTGDGIGDGITITAADPGRAALLKALNFEPGNPTSLFGGVQAAFESAGSDLTTMTGGGLDTPIPFVGSSVGQLIGAGASGAEGVVYTQDAGTPAVVGPPAVAAIPATTTLTDDDAEFSPEFVGRQVVVGSTVATIVDRTDTTLSLAPQLGSLPDADTPYLVENELLGAVHVLQAMTPATLQETVAMAQASLGNDSTIDFGLVNGTGGAQLRLDLTWQRAYGVSRSVSLEFDGKQLVGASGGGELSLEASGTVKLRLLIPLNKDKMADPVAHTLVDKAASQVSFDVTVDAEDAHIGADIGPMSVELGTLGDPDDTEDDDLGSFHAGFGVSATSAAASSTPTVKDFFSAGFDVEVGNGGADCGEDDDILCADFPVYVNDTPVSTKDDGSDNFTVTTTLGAGDDLTAVFGGTKTEVALPSGLQALINGTPFEFGSLIEGLQQYLFYAETSLRTASNGGEMPIIGKDLQAGADFMGDTRSKIDGFVEDNGDISQVGDARTLLTTKLAEELDIVLDGSDGIALDFTCKSTGGGPTFALNPPATAPGVKATGAVTADRTEYRYQVVSTYTDNSGVKDSLPSAVGPASTSPVVRNAAALTAAKFNTVTWKSVRGVTGYKVLRSTRTGPTATWGAPTLVGTTKSFSLSFRDKGLSSVAYTPATVAPQIPAGTACEDDRSVTDIEGVTLGMSMGQGDVSPELGCVDIEDVEGEPATDPERKSCVGGELPVDLGLPGLSLQTGDSGSVSGRIGWALDVKIGMSRSRGFYIDTEDENEFEVGAALKLDDATGTGPDLKAQLAIINVDVFKKNADAPEFVGHFGIDIKDADGALTLAEIARTSIAKAITVSVNADVNIDWHLEAAADAALPGVETDFKLTWGWGAKSGQPVGTPASNTDALVIRFNNVTLNAGTFFGEALEPYLTQIVDATKPLQPIIDTIFTPMPVISDLSKAAGGKEVTIASLADTFNTLPGGAKIQPFLKAIKTVKTLRERVKCTDSCGINIGSFNLLATRAATTGASAATANNLIDKTPGTPAKPGYDPKPNASTAIAAADKSGELAKPGTVSTAAKLRAGLAAGLAIPVMDDPTLLFGLISGGDIPLVEFDSGPLSLGFQFQKSFGPIYAPPPVMMVIGGGASVTLRIAAGFDTYGIRRAMETGDGAQVLDSLYFKTVDAAGKPIPVVQFTGYLEAGASVSLGILEVGVLGGIKLTVGFYWNDPNSDGKFRLFEFAGAVANNPICLFNVGGELSLYVKVFVVIGFSPFAVDFDFTLVNIKLLDFNLKPDCAPPPPRLGGTSGGVLYVFAGRFGGAGPRGNSAWDAKNKNETWVVRQVPAYTEPDGDKQPPAVEVRGLGLTESFPDTADNPISAVVLDGRDYTGNLTVSFTGGSAPSVDAKPEPFTKTAVVFTGAGEDVIRTGEGDSWVDSGPGADVVTTADRTDLSKPAGSVSAHVAGGGGPDVITVGNGNDTVSGDGSLTFGKAPRTVDLAPAKKGTVVLGDPVDVSSLVRPTAAQLHDPTPTPADPGADQIAAGLGEVVLSGNAGNDTIGTANDSTLADTAGVKAGTKAGTKNGSAEEEALYRAKPSVLVGGAGSDVMKSGSANDKLYTGTKADIGESDPGTGDVTADVNIVDTGTGADTVYGSNGQDFVTTSSATTQKAVVFGGAGADVLTGGLGSDEIYGGPDDDYVVASPATVGAPGSASDVLGGSRDVGVLPGAGASEKKLVGGTGSDRIYGADGPSTIFGDTTVDACTVQTDPVSKQPGETTNALDAADLVFGGTGVDVVNAGGGDDHVYASGAADRVCGNAGRDRLYGGDAADLVQAGTGDDQGFGDAGADQVYGNDGDDALYGGNDDDRLQGGSGADWLDGGTTGDVILGGTSRAGSTDGADVLLGAAGADVLVGDNAQTDVATGKPYPTDLGSSAATVSGDDYLVGGDDADSVHGGLGNDTAYGGTGDDLMEGNPGTDSISGEDGDDDLVGGSSELASGQFTGSEPGRPDGSDTLNGGTGQDVIAGDNARVARAGTAHPVTLGRSLRRTRAVDLADESSGSPTDVAGGDLITAGADTDVVFAQRGDDTVRLGDGADYGEGGPGGDSVHGDLDNDDVVGGSFTPASTSLQGPVGQPDAGDTLFGDAGQDVVLGDNGSLTRPVSTGTATTLLTAPTGSRLTAGRVTEQRAIAAYDLGDTPSPDTSGPDDITGDADTDVLLGQGGNDRTDGGTEADYAEGGQGSDLVLGGSEDDDVVGGSSATVASVATGVTNGTGQPDGADNVYGGSGSDLVIGDNGLLSRDTAPRDWRTNRTNATQTAVVPGRSITLHDLTAIAPAAVPHSAADSLSGQAGVDLLLGQDGDDRISGGGDDDYVEGEGGADVIHGDVALTSSEIVTAPVSSVWATPLVDGEALVEGQDDLTGGSIRKGSRDAGDVIGGDGDDDFVVGDNGSIARVVDGGRTERVHTQRYGPFRNGHAKVRVAGGGATSTRFCTAPASPTASSTCDVTAAYGADVIHGDAGQDVLYGQDANDTIRGGTGDDDVYGELGADLLFGEDGEDAIVGDRGGVQNRYETGSRSVVSSLTQPPKVTYTSRRARTVSREVDLQHDVNGTDLVGSATSAPMVLDGTSFGGVDRIRGGADHDSIHAGAGDDLVNGDSGGDSVFGGRGRDALWGGLGRVCLPTDTACLNDQGVAGEFIDHIAGGKDDDVIDWRPRGVYGTGTTFVGRTCTLGAEPVVTTKDTSNDPCSWFEMTERADDVATSPSTLSNTANNQHHQGIDWIYGGWDRDVMQGDVTANGPNDGDRLIDWNGVYNLYSHCNAAYGGFNDIRSPSPAMEKFIREWATGNGSGRPASGSTAADVATPGTSAYDELALVNNADGKGHGTGSAYPSTPGHFDNAGACLGF